MESIIKINLSQNGCYLVDIDRIGSKSLPIYYSIAELIFSRDEIYVLLFDKNTIGFIIFEIVNIDTKKIHIKSIAIDDKYRRKGYATKLLQYLKNNYSDITLYVQKGNQAIGLYKKNDFKIICEDSNYYTTLDEKCAYEMRYQKLCTKLGIASATEVDTIVKPVKIQ